MRPSNAYRNLAYRTFDPAVHGDPEVDTFWPHCEKTIAEAGLSMEDEDDLLEYVYAASEMWEIHHNGSTYCREENPEKISDHNPRGSEWVLYTKENHPGFQELKQQPTFGAGEGAPRGSDGQASPSSGPAAFNRSTVTQVVDGEGSDLKIARSSGSAPTSQAQLYRELAYKHFHPQLIRDIEDEENVARVCQTVLGEAGYPVSAEDDFLEFVFAATEMWEITNNQYTYRRERNPQKVRETNPEGWDFVLYTRQNHPAWQEDQYKDSESTEELGI